MAFQIRFSEVATHNANEILEWLVEEHAGDAGYRWFLGMREAIFSLGTMPKRCTLAPESAQFPYEVRQLLYGRKPNVYRVLFTIEDDMVYVLAIRRPHQQQLHP